MIVQKPVTFLLDDATGVALYQDKYVMFEGEAFKCIAPVDAMELYIAKKKEVPDLKIPAEFVAIKDVLMAKLAELNSL